MAELLINARREWVEEAYSVDVAFYPWISSIHGGQESRRMAGTSKNSVIHLDVSL